MGERRAGGRGARDGASALLAEARLDGLPKRVDLAF
jgi:hypothetical protein